MASTGFPTESIGAALVDISPLHKASSESCPQRPASGMPAPFVKSCLAFKRREVLPTSKAQLVPTASCSSSSAHGSGPGRPATNGVCPGATMGVAATFLCGVSPTATTSSHGASGSSGISRRSSCSRLSRSWTSFGGAGTRGPSQWPSCNVASSARRLSSSRASDSCKRYTPVWCTVQELIRNSFFLRSAWSRGMRKRGTRRCRA
mmetsp:Transcript_10020/g.22428  ORF Transcript_10020/g.22428 Transcript_10020/m.22428 type:complete len:205 (+) Transcript_10020:1061-1675(+)